MQFKAFEPDIEVNGNTVYAIVDGFGIVKSLAKSHLRKAGLPEEIDPGEWYSQEKWLQAFKSISEIYGDDTLFRIGMSIPQNASFPSNIETIENAIRAIDIAYHMNHRKNGAVMYDDKTDKTIEGIGNYGFQKVKDRNKIISECKNPYPCSFDQGIIAAMVNMINPDAKVIHDNYSPCRKNGEDSCTYIVTW
ncbi:MAG: hypothetical protein R6V04_16820 [bacterium]